jgi:trehalose 6-phosphate phosphatase
MSRHLLACLGDIGPRFADALGGVFLFSDFDGTLAPIVPEPALAQMRPELRNLLVDLSSRPGFRMAIVSGRALGDLRRHVGLKNLIYSGNHGLEIDGPGIAFVHPSSVEGRPRMAALAETLARRLAQIDGVWVENKGLTLAVHYRLARAGSHQEVGRQVEAAIEQARHGFRVTAGLKVLDIRPDASWTKGDAVAWIRKAYDAEEALPIYLGDDTTDEEAFASLPGAITVRVGPHGKSAASYHLSDPGEVEVWLTWLASLCKGSVALAG